MLSYPTILAKQAIDSTTETPLAIDDSGTSPRFDFELVFDKNTPFTALSDREGYDLQCF